MGLGLTATSATKGKKSAPKPKVMGMEAEALRLRVLKHEIDERTAEFDVVRGAIVDRCREDFSTNLGKGVYLHHYEVVAEGSPEPVDVIFTDRYRKIEGKHAPTLRAALGGTYGQAIEDVVDLSLAEGASLDALKMACGDRWDAVRAVLTVTESIKPKAGFGALRARASTDPVIKATLDEIAGFAAYEPMVKPG